ncbi:GNAT family N-acetyltransferase [Chachezhania sediminis]|uniref:GNAT family N-acetyltransferase n=1 Tax=Chachezhania sediminis TaxID=2599291 RepID=UPI00131E475C|nr:GNAT family N-acetyltransferase [Chachezhania sediminis]
MNHGSVHPLLPLQQHPSFAAALALIGRAPAVEAGTLILRRRLLGLPVTMAARFDPDRLPDLQQAFARRAAPLVLSPDGPCPGLARMGAVPLVSPATVAEIDLTRPEAERRAAQHQKWRNRLVAAERAGLKVSERPMPMDAGHWLFAADRQMSRRRGYRSWPPALTLAFIAANTGKARLYTAHAGKSEIAAMLVLRHGPVATYHMGHTTPEGRALSAHTLLLWKVSRSMARAGCRRLDLGLINGEDAPGLAGFKLGSGATARPLGGTWAWWPPLGRGLAPLARLDRRLMAPGPGPSPAPRSPDWIAAAGRP